VVLKLLTMKRTFLWDATPCGSLEVLLVACFVLPEDGGNFFRNVGELLSNYSTLFRGRLEYYLPLTNSVDLSPS
jgi:hypothetical protein